MTGAATGVLRAPELLAVVRELAAALETHKETVNRLNVYPVPDGDTGTNMCLTVRSALAEMEALGEGAELEAVCSAMAHGSLMGARGNSGVILCQMLRALAAAFSGVAAVDGAVLATGLAEAAAAARSAVMRPVEGTMLSVAAAAAGGGRAVPAGAGLREVAAAARRAAAEALARTPEQLAVLAEAGVVDAGGAGLVLLFDAFVSAAGGGAMPLELPLPEEVAELLRHSGGSGVVQAGRLRPPRSGGKAEGLKYEVMYLLEAPDALVAAFKDVWAGIGDSIVVVGGEGLWNCHIHTDDVGAAIEAALDAGRPREIRVTDLSEQVEEEAWVDRARAAAPPGPAAADGPPPRTAVVAVATGDGIRRIFHSLGVRRIVAGGQSMNPSTAEVLEMIESAPGEEVVILPNNRNIFAVAAEAAGLSKRPAVVLPTPGIQEGFAALMEYDPEASAESNREAMERAAAHVVAGEVTRAVRAGETPAGRVEPGDWLGLTREGIAVVARSASEAACGLLGLILSPDHEMVTIIEGTGSSPAETRRVTEWLAERRPDLSVDLHHGGQPLYPYLVAAE